MSTENTQTTAPANTSSPAPEPQTFSVEYVRELRAENKGWRLKASEIEGRLSAAEAAAAKAKADAEGFVSQARQDADARVVRAELKAHALRAGIVDLDGLRLADLSTMKLNAAGEVEGAEALLEALKASKPYLFQATGAQTGTTSQTQKPPTPSPSTGKKASDLTEAEFEAELARLTGRRK